MKTANSFPVWIIASLIIGIVIFQAIVFIRLASKTAPSVGLTTREVKSVVRTGAISSLGPSFAIIIVAISLITLLGNPVTLMRIGIVRIGSNRNGWCEPRSAGCRIGTGFVDFY